MSKSTRADNVVAEKKAGPSKNIIKLVIKTQDRDETFHVPQNMVALDLKFLVAERFKVPAPRLRLIYAGSVLKDTDTLAERNVKDGYTVHLAIREDLPPESRFDNLLPWPEEEAMLANAIGDPDPIQGLLNDIFNPNYVREVTRNYGSALRSIEDMPGGLEALESYYNFLENFQTDANTAPSSDVNPPDGSNAPVKTVADNLAPEQSNPWTLDLVAQMISSPPVQQLMLELANDPNFLQAFVEYMRNNLPDVMEDLGTSNGLRDYMAQMAQQRPAPPIQPPAVRYSNQLEQLQLMGFTDRDTNLRALVRTFGNLNGAVEILSRDE